MGFNACQEHDKTSIIENVFTQHLSEYGISYGTKEEFEFRLNIFKTKDAEYLKINANPDNTFQVDHNKFSTWTDAEFKKLLGYRGPLAFDKNETITSLKPVTATEVDWRADGAVNPVQD
jgi:hypothetical protein